MPWGAAAWLAWTVAVAYTLAPFDLAAPNAFRAIGDTSALDLLGHALAFAAVGVADRLGFSPSGPHTSDGYAQLARPVLLCAALEAGQALVSSRHATLLDFLTNTCGVFLGRAAGPWLLKAVRGLPIASRGAPSHLIRKIALPVWAVFWCGLMLLPPHFVSLKTWDSTYPLLIGNEVGGERPWDGEVGYVAIYDRAITAEQARALARRPPGESTDAVRTNLGLLAGYLLRRTEEPDFKPSGAAASNELSIHVPAATQWAADPRPDLILEKATWLTTAGPARDISERIASTEAFSIEVWGRPRSPFQEGPARIVGISTSQYRRNVTLGQEGGSLVFRVRNRLNGPNGTMFELHSPEMLTTGGGQIVATYSHGRSALFVNGESAGTVDLRESAVLLGLGTGPASVAAAAVFAALSLLVVAPASGLHPVADLLRLLAIGYGVLLVASFVSVAATAPPTWGLLIGFGPALLACFLVLRMTKQ